jgi:hypothetical protein
MHIRIHTQHRSHHTCTYTRAVRCGEREKGEGSAQYFHSHTLRVYMWVRYRYSYFQPVVSYWYCMYVCAEAEADAECFTGRVRDARVASREGVLSAPFFFHLRTYG